MSKFLIYSFHVPAENSTKIECKKLTILSPFPTKISKSFIIYLHSNSLISFSVKFWSEQFLPFLEDVLNQIDLSGKVNVTFFISFVNRLEGLFNCWCII